MTFVRGWLGKREKSKWDPVSAEALPNPPGCSEDGMSLYAAPRWSRAGPHAAEPVCL